MSSSAPTRKAPLKTTTAAAAKPAGPGALAAAAASLEAAKALARGHAAPAAAALAAAVPAPPAPAPAPGAPLRPPARKGALPPPPAAAPPLAAAPAPAPGAKKPKGKAAEEKEAKEGEAKEGEGAEKGQPKKTRAVLSKALGIHISHARAASQLKRVVTDEGVRAHLAELRAASKEAKAGGDETRIKSTAAEIQELAKKQLRMSANAPIAAAIIADLVTYQLLHHGLGVAQAAEKKIMGVAHLHGGAFAHPCGAIFAGCPSWAGWTPAAEDILRVQQALYNKELRDDREARKQEAAAQATAAAAKGLPAPAKAPRLTRKALQEAAAAAASASAEAEAAADGGETVGTEGGYVSFNTYVDGVLRGVREEHPAFKDMRVSARTREYLSGLVAEMIERLARQGQILVQDLMKVRTIDAEHILVVVKQLMADRGVASADIAGLLDHVAKKLECYQAHLAGEHARREENRDDAKKAELELAKLRKKAEQTARQKELAAKRSVEAVARAALLGQALEALAPQVEAAAAVAAKAAEAKAAAEAAEAAEAAVEAEAAEAKAAAPVCA